MSATALRDARWRDFAFVGGRLLRSQGFGASGGGAAGGQAGVAGGAAGRPQGAARRREGGLRAAGAEVSVGVRQGALAGAVAAQRSRLQALGVRGALPGAPVQAAPAPERGRGAVRSALPDAGG